MPIGFPNVKSIKYQKKDCINVILNIERLSDFPLIINKTRMCLSSFLSNIVLKVQARDVRQEK